MEKMKQLLEIMATLRDPEKGCPWDKKQDFQSISAYTVEEAYEVADAIERKNLTDLKDELGDLLFQVVFHSQMAQELGAFDFNDVVAAISDKLVRRHPHVFEQDENNQSENGGPSEEALFEQWEAHKRSERKSKEDERFEADSSELDGIASTLPALRWSEKIQKRAAGVGFEWPNIDSVWAKLDEEIAELKQEVGIANNQDRIEDELGDVLFVCANLAKYLKINPEQALRRANQKFIKRFKLVEQIVQDKNTVMSACEIAELEACWQQAKGILAAQEAPKSKPENKS